MSSLPFLIQSDAPPGWANHTGGSGGRLDGNHCPVPTPGVKVTSAD